MADQTLSQFTKGDVIGWEKTFEAEGDITKYMVVQLGTAYPQVKPYVDTATPTDPVIGVAAADAEDGELVPIWTPTPIVNVICEAAGITRGELVIPGATTDGYCQSEAISDGTSLTGVVGLALLSGDTILERVPVLLGHVGLRMQT